MPQGQGQQVGVGRASGRGAPPRPFEAIDVIGNGTAARSQRVEHPAQHIGRLTNRNAPRGSLHRHTHKADLGDRRGAKPYSTGLLLLCDPAHRAPVIHMIRPPPSDQHIDIKQVAHGKSASSSRVASTVSGADESPVPPKILAPVNGHRRSLMRGAGRPGDTARRRRNSETVTRSRRAPALIARASSGRTLNEIVTMVLP
jgi:hypothetical protein